MKIMQWLKVHRSAILATVVILQNAPGISNGVKNVLGVFAFALGA